MSTCYIVGAPFHRAPLFGVGAQRAEHPYRGRVPHPEAVTAARFPDRGKNQTDRTQYFSSLTGLFPSLAHSHFLLAVVS